MRMNIDTPSTRPTSSQARAYVDMYLPLDIVRNPVEPDRGNRGRAASRPEPSRSTILDGGCRLYTLNTQRRHHADV